MAPPFSRDIAREARNRAPRVGGNTRVAPHLVPSRDLYQRRKITAADVKAARDWFRQRAAQTVSADPQLILAGTPSRMSTKFVPDMIGSMFHFLYDAKHKDTLPYWDMFPLVFPIEPYHDGFLGINLHYLPIPLRARLMDALYTTALTNDKNQAVQLQLSYGILRSASRFRYFAPCVKRYLSSHMQSRFFYVAPKEWDVALALPTARFQKTGPEVVWRDSMKRIRRSV